jgi:cobalt-zinc-cadmium efflux system protein
MAPSRPAARLLPTFRHTNRAMAHDHSHSHADPSLSDGRLVASIALNLLLTVVQVVAGIVSGSLSLAADALHNFSDCGALVIALVARRVARRPSDLTRTFGYRRAEIIGALVNLTVLIVVGLYLVYEAVARLVEPREIEGWIVVGVASFAFVVDVLTAALLWAMSRGNLNLRAAFMHNVSDALASLGVILAGTAILLWDAYWTDAVLTLVIAGYILWQSYPMMLRTMHILMESVPPDIDVEALIAELETIPDVEEVHEVHVWEIDEEHRAMEAHIVVDSAEHAKWTAIKQEVKIRLHERFNISHSTIELEYKHEACDHCPPCSL